MPTEQQALDLCATCTDILMAMSLKEDADTLNDAFSYMTSKGISPLCKIRNLITYMDRTICKGSSLVESR